MSSSSRELCIIERSVEFVKSLLKHKLDVVAMQPCCANPHLVVGAMDGEIVKALEVVRGRYRLRI
jgi:hypothetical protein